MINKKIYHNEDINDNQRSIKLSQLRSSYNEKECLICGELKNELKLFMPCDSCRKKYLRNDVLLVETIGDKEQERPTGLVMVMRGIAFEQVFNQNIPKEHVIKVEVGVLQKMQEHINSVEN